MNKKPDPVKLWWKSPLWNESEIREDYLKNSGNYYTIKSAEELIELRRKEHQEDFEDLKNNASDRWEEFCSQFLRRKITTKGKAKMYVAALLMENLIIDENTAMVIRAYGTKNLKSLLE